MEGTVYPRPEAARVDSVVTPVKSAASWPAIIAGAFVAIAASLILLILGSGIGLTRMLPWADHGISWADHGISGKSIVVTTAIWLIVTQWISSGLGGYIAGRLRVRWHGTHTHEVFFRDTAHGLVTWAVATVAVAALIGASVHSMIAGGLHAASGTSAPYAMTSAPYAIDKLFRSTNNAEGQRAGDPRVEADHVLENATATGSLPDADRTYLAGLIAAKTGISVSDAQTRLDDWLAKNTEREAKVKAEAAAGREATIYYALSLLIGAFIASVTAALGGRLRDEHP
jgi:hypothetical protein